MDASLSARAKQGDEAHSRGVLGRVSVSPADARRASSKTKMKKKRRR